MGQNLVAEQAVKTGGSMIPFPMGRGNDFASSLGIHNHKDVKIALPSGVEIPNGYSEKSISYDNYCNNDKRESPHFNIID